MPDSPNTADIVERIKAAAEIAELRAALAPFLNIRDQYPQSAKLIIKNLDGLTPITVTVTKAQFAKALAALKDHRKAQAHD